MLVIEELIVIINISVGMFPIELEYWKLDVIVIENTRKDLNTSIHTNVTN